MTAPREVALDPGAYMEVLEEDLLNEIRRTRVYRTQVRQLEKLVGQYQDRFGALDETPMATSPETPMNTPRATPDSTEGVT